MAGKFHKSKGRVGMSQSAHLSLTLVGKVIQFQDKLYEQYILLSGFLTIFLNILQRTRINIGEKNSGFLISLFRFVHLSLLLISAFPCVVISSGSNDYILVVLLLVEETAQAVTQNYHKLELAPRPEREYSDVMISYKYPGQIKQNSERSLSMHLPNKGSQLEISS